MIRNKSVWLGTLYITAMMDDQDAETDFRSSSTQAIDFSDCFPGSFTVPEYLDYLVSTSASQGFTRDDVYKLE